MASKKKQDAAAPEASAPGLVNTGQAALLALARELVEEIQGAIRKDFPSNSAIHAEFAIGQPWPSGVKGAIARGRFVAGAAPDYRTNLIGRGVDVTKVNRLSKALDDLEKE